MEGIQVLQGPLYQGGLGNDLVNAFGTGLQRLAEHKLNDILQEKETQKKSQFWKSLGIPEEASRSLANAPIGIQQSILDRLENIGFNGQSQANQPSYQQQAMQAGSQAGAQARMPQGQMAPQGSMMQPKGMGQQQAVSQDSVFKLGPSKEQQKQLNEQRKMKFAEQKEINKTVLPYIKETQDKAKSAKENDVRLNRMEKLVHSGKLNNPQFASLLKTIKHGVFGVGIDFEGLLSPESQEFNKISTDFVKSAKDIFGSRLTDTDLKTFLQTVPTLSQSNEGKLSVINNLKIMNKAAEIKNRVARELLKEYGNNPPLDFEAEVEEIAKPELDALAAKFEAGYQGKKTKTSSLLGDVVGSIGQTLLGNS